MAELKILNHEDFQKKKGVGFILSKQTLEASIVQTFGKITGDWNEHNEKETEFFKKPTVQGCLSLSLFGGFHKEICCIPHSDPMNTQVRGAQFKLPLYVGSMFTPSLMITETTERPKYTEVVWKYELWNENEQLLMEASFILRYSK